jgi:hypothetical protein
VSNSWPFFFLTKLFFLVFSNNNNNRNKKREALIFLFPAQFHASLHRSTHVFHNFLSHWEKFHSTQNLLQTNLLPASSNHSKQTFHSTQNQNRLSKSNSERNCFSGTKLRIEVREKSIVKIELRNEITSLFARARPHASLVFNFRYFFSISAWPLFQFQGYEIFI